MLFSRMMVLVSCFLVTFADIGLANDAAITVDVENVIVPEGRTATFRVRLSVQPDSPVNVTVSRGDGDTDIKVESGSHLTFTPSNWDRYQTVTLQALKDGDTTNGSVTIRLSTPGMPEKHVVAVESDNGTVVLRRPQPPMNLRMIDQ